MALKIKFQNVQILDEYMLQFSSSTYHVIQFLLPGEDYDVAIVPVGYNGTTGAFATTVQNTGT